MEIATTNIVASLTLSLLMTLSQWFSDGVTQYKKQDYEAAAKSFTQVIDARAKHNPLLQTSLYWRAQCYAKLKDKKRAAADLTRLIESNPGAEMETVAIADYKTFTGKEWAGLNLTTPENTWKSIKTAAIKHDIKMLDKCLTGDMKEEMIDELGEDPDGWNEFAKILGNTTFEASQYNAASNKAVVTFTMAFMGEVDQEQLLMIKQDGKWLLADEYGGKAKREFEENPADKAKPLATARSDWNSDMNKLRMLDAAVEQFAMASNGMPKTLADAADYVRDFAATQTSAVNKKPFAFAVTPDGNTHWIYMSSPVDGKRQGMISGSLRTVTEAKFKTLAKAAGIKIPQDWSKVKVSEAEAGDIDALIQQLGVGNFKARKQAYDKLKTMGAKAAPRLQRAQQNPDPEIAIQVKKLLAEL